MIHDLIAFLRDAFRPHRHRPAIPELTLSRELVTESHLQRNRGERLIRLVEDEREQARLSRLDLLRDYIKADEIAPLPPIWGEGRGRDT